MYKLTVGAMFKNEAHCLLEWIEHYLFHGADHFWLINDGSTDNFMEILQPYIDKNIVTLFESNEPYYLGRQRNLYNRYFLPNFQETEWLLIVDLDEFVWSPMDVNIRNILDQAGHLGQIQVRTTLFGSNDHIKQPRV